MPNTPRIISLFLMLCLLISLLAGCTSATRSEEPNAPEKEEIPENPDPQTPEIPEASEAQKEPNITEEPAVPDLPESKEETKETEESPLPQDLPEGPAAVEPEDQKEPENQEEPKEELIAGPNQKSSKDSKELPRNKFKLPMPMTELEEEYAALCLPECAPVDDSYFEGAVFLGDSVTLGLKKYVTKLRKKDPDFLSDARFLAIGSYGVYEALLPPGKETMHDLMNGVQTQPQDILAAWEAKTVFIWLGLNDAGLFPLDENMEYYAELITRIRIANPGIRIIILPTTPMTIEGERKSLYNYRIDTYNRAVMKLAADYGCYYCYIAEILKDDEGYLPDSYSSDNYVHLVYEAYDLVLDYIRTHAVTPEMEQTQGTVLIDAASQEGYEGDMGSR